MSERIDIVVTKTGDDAAAKGISGVGDAATKSGKQVDALNSALNFLKASLAGLGVIEVAKQYQEMSDTFSGIVSRLKLVTQNASQLVAVEKQLLDAANSTRGSFEATASLYTKLAAQTGQLGIDQKSLIPTIKTINQLIAISGATSEEAKSGLLQFSQGLASNRFQGDELRSVLENLPALGAAIAKGLGTTTGGLRTMGEQGQLSAKLILDALSKQAPEIAKQFAAITPTIGGAFQVLKNNALQMVGTFDQVNRIGSTVAGSILLIANNLQLLVSALGTATGAVLAFYAGLAAQSAWNVATTSISLLITRFQAMRAFIALTGVEVSLFSRALFLLQTPVSVVSAAFTALNAVIRANPIATIITLLGAAAAALYFFGNQINITSDGSITALGAVVGILRTLWDLIKQVGSYVAAVFAPIWTALGTVISTAFNVALQGIRGLLDFLAQFIPSLQGASGSLSAFGQTIVKNMQEATKSLKDTTLASADFGKGFKDTADTVGAAAGSIAQSAKFVNDTYVQMGRVVADAIPPFENLVIAYEKLKPAIEFARDSVKRYTQDVKAAADAADYLATHVRNAFGDMVEVTDEWARRSGAAFNQVKGQSAQLADSVQQSADAYSSSISQMNAATASLSGGATEGSRTFTTYTPPPDNEVQAFFKAAGGTDTGIIGAINTLGSDIASHNPAAAQEIVDVWKRLQGQPAAVKDVLKAQFPFLVNTLQGAGLSFANGGSFMVGGQGGTDSQLVQFLASPDEQVSVTTPRQRRAAAAANGGKTIIVNMNVSTPDANSFRRSRNQNLLALQSQLARV